MGISMTKSSLLPIRDMTLRARTLASSWPVLITCRTTGSASLPAIAASSSSALACDSDLESNAIVVSLSVNTPRVCLSAAIFSSASLAVLGEYE